MNLKVWFELPTFNIEYPKPTHACIYALQPVHHGMALQPVHHGMALQPVHHGMALQSVHHGMALQRHAPLIIRHDIGLESSGCLVGAWLVV